MTPQDIALASAGFIGAVVAVVHGVITQRLMVRPFAWAVPGDARVPVTIRRLVPVLLHFSTASWFAGGLLLIAVACGLVPEARAAAGLFVGGLYLYGAVGNAWGTRGRHPGWMLMAVAIALIAFGIG